MGNSLLVPVIIVNTKIQAFIGFFCSSHHFQLVVARRDLLISLATNIQCAVAFKLVIYSEKYFCIVIQSMHIYICIEFLNVCLLYL